MTASHPVSLRGVLALWLACAGVGLARDGSAGLIASDKGGAVGYRHALERSRFEVGPSPSGVHRLEEHGFVKVVGPQGVFATHSRNGLVIAVQSDGAPKAGASWGAPEARYGAGPDQHNAQVLEYFRAAGIPGDQIGGVHANTYLSARGSTNESRPVQPQVDGYASILERKVEGYAVVDSVAWARLDDRGRSISEWVYWPPIPARALEEARKLEALLGGAGRSDYLARLPAGLPAGRVVIRHSSAVAEGPFEAFASYDVASPALRQASTVVRHFDADGLERRLPQERRGAGPDFPPR
ncbi:hypothetical protein LY474_18860 [Myxococcus stipitatus]|uniref:hypothetical protein n=1 Tax=Myxococcus stipitatus TaxID=83455 RepID=UPI001F1BF6AA|nr:hypothetical protein [Myxococcus stipitatus]MCE9669862.1 hypothetical protein [Myxococcus stipitatus]